jgi:hypothetical protein
VISCLNNYIGVRGIVEYEDPDSGYYINDLQGITTNQLEEISDDEDHYEVRLAWADIYARSSRLLESDIKNAMKKYFKRYSYVDNSITGQLVDNEAISSSNNWSGVRFNFGYESKNLVLNVSTFDIYLSSAANFTVKVFDLNTGQTLDEIDFEGIQGLNTYRINKNYAAHRYNDIFVAYDANSVESIKMADYQGDYPTQIGSVSKNSPVISSNFNGGNTGISITYNLECSVSNFVCQRIDSFKDAFLYKLGVEFCNERIYSDRINRYTLMDIEEATQLRTEFNDQYNLLIEAALKDLNVHENDVCFECNKAVSYKTMLP